MNTCAWCLQEAGEAPQDGDSHGICARHAEQMIRQRHWQKLQQFPSYVERNAAESAQEEQKRSA